MKETRLRIMSWAGRLLNKMSSLVKSDFCYLEPLYIAPRTTASYATVTDNDDETLSLAHPLTLGEDIVPNTNEKPRSLVAPPPLPEYAVEVTP